MAIIYDSDTIFIGSIHGTESLTCEYKEFYLQTLYKFFEIDDLKKLVENPNHKLNTIAFNNMIKLELKFYFTTYFAKYCASFIASKINGKLHIGITDNGIVEGFPFYGTHENNLNAYTQRIFKDSLRSFRVCCKNTEVKERIYDWYVSNTIIKVIKLEINDDFIDNSYKERLEQHKRKAHKIKDAWAKYRTTYAEWVEKFMFYSQKLKTLMNHPKVRVDIIPFIVKRSTVLGLKKSEYASAIAYYESKEQRIEEITVELILKIKNDNANPVKWLVEYKDNNIDNLRKIKPRSPISMDRDMDYNMYLSRMRNLIPYLKDKGYNFYKIEIHIKYNPEFEKIGHSIEYKDKNGQWNCKKRVVVNGFPITVDIYDMSCYYK